jgi:signal transduction histidine kinase/CheY-like chemotaxis protein
MGESAPPLAGDARKEASPLRTLVASYAGPAAYVGGGRLWLNRHAETMTGFGAAELPSVEAWFDGVFRGDAARSRSAYESSRRRGFPQSDVLTIRRSDGTPRRVEFTGYLGDGEEVWFMRDVTASLQAEQVLRNREQRLRLTADAAGLGTWEWDIVTGRVVSDATARRLFGLHEEEQARTFDDYLARIHPDDRAQLEDAIGTALETQSAFDTEFRVRSHHRRDRWLRCRGVVAEGESSAGTTVIVAVQDIDDHMRLDERLIHAARMDSLGQLAGGIAHDFNNLLAVVQGQAEFVAADPDISEASRSRLASIERAAAKGAEMVSSLMELGRSNTAAATVVDINRLLGTGADALRQVVGADVTVELGLDAEVPFVRFSEARLAAAILNLVTNARDAMPGGGTLRIQTDNPPQPHGDVPEPPPVQLTIQDDGVGMDRPTRQRIFEPFFTTKPPGIGTGLGLTSVYDAVMDAGGVIDVTSTPGKGSKFAIWLPGAVPDHAVEADPAMVMTHTPGGQTILVVEDDAAVLEVTAEVLRSAGYRVVEALGSDEALEAVAGGETPSLLLTDVVMPDLTGPQLAARITEQLPAIRVLFMSGYASADRTGAALAEEELLRKPFSHQHLLERITMRFEQP